MSYISVCFDDPPANIVKEFIINPTEHVLSYCYIHNDSNFEGILCNTKNSGEKIFI